MVSDRSHPVLTDKVGMMAETRMPFSDLEGHDATVTLATGQQKWHDAIKYLSWHDAWVVWKGMMAINLGGFSCMAISSRRNYRKLD